MQTVLITGGTGLVGTALSQILINKGYKVIILTRSPEKKAADANRQYAYWNIKKQEIETEVLKTTDYIVHLTGAGVVDKKWSASYKKEIVESRTESSRLIVNTLKNNEHKVKAVISASAIGFYGPDKASGEVFTETDNPADNFLGETCRLWEASIAPVKESGVRLVILRTGIVLSNEGGALAEFKKPLRFGMAAILGHGRQLISWIHIEDLCRMYMMAIEDKNMQGTFNAVAPHPVSNKVLTLSLAKIRNGNLYLPFYVPAFLLKLVLGQRSIEVLKSANVSNQKIQDKGFIFHFSSVTTALKNLVKK